MLENLQAIFFKIIPNRYYLFYFEEFKNSLRKKFKIISKQQKIKTIKEIELFLNFDYKQAHHLSSLFDTH